MQKKYEEYERTFWDVAKKVAEGEDQDALFKLLQDFKFDYQCLLVISLVHVLVIGTLCFLHSFLNFCSAFEKVRTVQSPTLAGPKWK